ncbi:hypothetical protein DER45DRAFT_551999 [Fusarium avenaceum]|nr:hypothetical protein DER45DRAFT_551999 [Fusarium avenaceum]
MSGSMDITTTSDNAESQDAAVAAAAAAPTKPSLRTLDQASTNLATREEDLVHGPWLLGIGDGQEHAQDPHLYHPGLGLPSGDSAHNSANEIPLPFLPLGMRLSLSARTMTESTGSRSGPSLSLPSGSIRHEALHHPEETTRPGNQNRAALPLACHYEFSWENSHLCFRTSKNIKELEEPLEIVKVLAEKSSEANQASESRLSASQASISGLPAPLSGAGESDLFSTAGIGGFCSSAEVRPTLSLPEDFEVASIQSSVFSDDSKFDNAMVDGCIGESTDPKVAIAMEEKAEWVAELLIDDFFRSYARQKSRKETAATKDQDLANEPDNKAQRFAGDRGHVKKLRNSRATSRIEGSEDEDSGDDGQGPSGAAKSSDSPHLTCPFLKWNPMRYAKTCNQRYMQIRHIKYHLRDKHQQNYCPKCEMIFKETDIPAHPCDPKRVRPRGLMTKEKLLEIQKLPGSEVEWKKRQLWQKIYKILFPNEPPCLNPYFNKKTDMRLAETEQYFRLPEVRAFIREKMESRAYEYQVKGNYYQILFSIVLPEAWGKRGINDKGKPYMTHDKEPATQYSQPSKRVEFGACDTIIPNDIGNDTSQHPHDGITMPQFCAVTGSTDYSASMSERFAAQEQNENITSDFFPDLTHSGEFPDPARRGLMGICGSGNWEMPAGQNFTDPCWSTGYEVGSDLMSES